MTAYYNEHDPAAVAWLRELIREGLIADGVVDERSIHDVRAADVVGFERVHFFAGIGGRDYALQLAGWPAGRPVWTGSCPCQPFSAAGKRRGADDERHLWPEMRRLVAECRPATVLGEQVASKDGRQWLAGVRTDLEALGYAVGAADLCSAGVGAPNIRQRLWWVADSSGERFRAGSERVGYCESKVARRIIVPGRHGAIDSMAKRRSEPSGRSASGGCGTGGMGDASSEGFQERVGNGEIQRAAGRAYTGQAAELRSDVGRVFRGARTECPRSPWDDWDAVYCRDGKFRRVEPGTFPLAARLPGRVAALRGYGNAINPWVAKEFLEAYLEAREVVV